MPPSHRAAPALSAEARAHRAAPDLAAAPAPTLELTPRSAADAMAAAELSALNNVRPVEVVAEAPASELTPPSREEKKALDELTNIVKTELAGELTRLTKLFQKWDIDHSGAIDRDEFRRGVKALSQSATDEICDVIFRECDVDGSGSIDSSEFVRYAVRDSLFRQKGRM